MEFYESVSRGGNELKNRETQQKLFENIKKTANDSGVTDAHLLNLRKIREGLLSQEVDYFAVEVHETCVDYCLSKRNMQELFKVLKSLVFEIYENYFKHCQSRSIRENEVQRYLLLYFICYSKSENIYMHKFSWGFPDILKLNDSIKLKNYFQFNKLYSKWSTNDLIFIDYIIPCVQDMIAEMFKKSYYTYSTKLFCKYMIIDEDNLEKAVEKWGWVISEDSIVVRKRK